MACLQSYVISPNASNSLVYHDSAEVFPSREEHMDLNAWEAAGFNRNDAARFLAVHRNTLNHPNVHNTARFPGASQLMWVVGTLQECMSILLVAM